jgi:UDP-N-acetylglucosamine 2-epimerase (non-hydrolysing)
MTVGKVIFVVGARPNFMKVAPILMAMKSHAAALTWKLVHTGQHYDAEMKQEIFVQLRIPEPDIDLKVGSGSHAVQTAEIMKRFEPVLEEERPQAIVVVGDVNSTIACALVAVKKEVRVVHVEAGLRSYDRGMPEEVNRVLTDQLSDLLFTTERSAGENLSREGIDQSKVHFVGNVMIDSLRANLGRAVPAEDTLRRFSCPNDAHRGFGLITLHRPSNVDDFSVLTKLIHVLSELSHRLPLVFPIHPRTRTRLEEAALGSVLAQSRITLVPPMPYLEMLGLMSAARVVMTDSGGLQEETTALGIPCITLRENTERPITVDEGTNTVVGTDVCRIRSVFEDTMSTGGKGGRVPELWDGRASTRIAAILERWLLGDCRNVSGL